MGDLVGDDLLQALYWQFCEPDDNPIASQASQSSSSSSSQASTSETYLLGFIIANIVGLRHYSGTTSGREMVDLVREPLNPYDENAIRVLNTRTIQVGHIEHHQSEFSTIRSEKLSQICIINLNLKLFRI